MPDPSSRAIRILFLAANPASTDRLRLDAEVRAIDQALRQADYRDQFEIAQHWAVRVSDLQGLLLRHRPDIVHFSGHGASQGEIMLEDDRGQVRLVQPLALAALFGALRGITRLVFLNACFSATQAQAIAQHVECVLGMPAEVEDSASIAFAASFYQALAYGTDVRTAFDLGCVQIDLDSLDNSSKPALLAQRVDARQVVFAAAAPGGGAAQTPPAVSPPQPGDPEAGSSSAATAPSLLPSQRRHLETKKRELEGSYAVQSRKLAALDTDIGREIDSERKLVLEERRAELSAERDRTVQALEDLERQLAAGAPQGLSRTRPSVAASSVGVSQPRAVASILFDESHGQALWYGAAPTIDKGFRAIASVLRQRTDGTFVPSGGQLTPRTLAGHQALVLALGPQGQTRLAAEELDAIRGFVRNGGGLLVLGAYTGDWHHEGNLNQLLGDYGMAFNRDVVMPAGAQDRDGKLQGTERSPKSSYAIEVRPAPGIDTGQEPARALLDGVPAVVTLSSCSLYVDEDLAVGLLASSADSVLLEPVPIGVTIYIDRYRDIGRGPAIVLAASKSSKVVVGGSWKMFLDAFVADARYANARLFQNIVTWLAV